MKGLRFLLLTVMQFDGVKAQVVQSVLVPASHLYLENETHLAYDIVMAAAKWQPAARGALCAVRRSTMLNWWMTPSPSMGPAAALCSDAYISSGTVGWLLAREPEISRVSVIWLHYQSM
jgi:hypothetical protein